MWLANALTLVRIPLAGLFWLAYGHLAWSLAIVGVAALTDALDGTVARWARGRPEGPPEGGRRGRSGSTAGEWLDPLADKVFVFGVLAATAVRGTTAWALVALVCARELLLVPLAIAYRLTRPRAPHAFQADRLGKAATIAQLAAVLAIVFGLRAAPLLAVVAAVLGLAAVAHYVVRGIARRSVKSSTIQQPGPKASDAASSA